MLVTALGQEIVRLKIEKTTEKTVPALDSGKILVAESMTNTIFTGKSAQAK